MTRFRLRKTCHSFEIYFWAVPYRAGVRSIFFRIASARIRYGEGDARSAPKIVCDDWHRSASEDLAGSGLSELILDCIAIAAPRNGGRSLSLQSFIYAAILDCPLRLTERGVREFSEFSS